MAKKNSNISETNTENIFRNFYGSQTFIEKSAIPARFGFKSKKKTGEKGYPDFFKEEDAYVIIVEAKGTSIQDAEEDVRFYSEHNKVKKDIISIAIAGQTGTTYIAKYFIKLQGGSFETINSSGKLMPIKDITKLYRKTKYGDSITTDALKKELSALNKTFHEKMHIKDTERSLFFAGLMIALKDSTFISTYRNISAPNNGTIGNLLESHNLNKAIVDAIANQISSKANNHSKEYNWRDRFSFIMNVDYPLADYIEVIEGIEKTIFAPFQNDEKQDILGRAYKIFLSRAGKVDNKNIILTPDHIKGLMVRLARLNTNDVVLDTCTGSGGFLMESMEVMIDLAKNDSSVIDRIQSNQLIGFELDPTLFALACSNMFLHGDGRTNLIFGSSLFDENEAKDKKMIDYIKSLKPTKCIINPPYEKNAPILFTKQALDLLEPNGKLIIIMPTPTLKRNINGITEEILSMAKLDYVIKMPANLFAEQKRAVNTSIFCFTKTPHNESDLVSFYNMEDDGHVSVQHKGRVDKKGMWDSIADNVVACMNHSAENSFLMEKRQIFDNGVINCYGYKSTVHSSKYQLVPFDKLFIWESGTLQSEAADDDGEYDFVTASETWKKHSNYSKDCEALVYAVSAGGSLGRTHYVNGKFIASNLCLVMTPKDPKTYPLNLRFYSFYLNHIRKQIVRDIADGTSKLTINPDDLRGYYINYYPIDEQNRLVKEYEDSVIPALSAADKAKNEFEKSIEKVL
ncbi:MAG: N-6 DNA methylase [Prevotellaceae bacterium]|nr:N-6 DNA methylase [Candidatus Faecinaster equi]